MARKHINADISHMNADIYMRFLPTQVAVLQPDKTKHSTQPNMPRVNVSGARSKYWVGTWNHAGPKEADIDASATKLQDSTWFAKIYASQERGESGTLHLQIYAECKNRKYWSELCDQFPGMFWETRNWELAWANGPSPETARVNRGCETSALFEQQQQRAAFCLAL
ncbi:unnamed protein product [Rotaria magnacalcarata]|uniref:Uncharacterized protein n=1 Tax=Rotaria magnacalcarata TaxID=392030 RepID=A0A817AG39_9BILA|nr:unnamed protein product [Rotaria magnacalcarata]